MVNTWANLQFFLIRMEIRMDDAEPNSPGRIPLPQKGR